MRFFDKCARRSLMKKQRSRRGRSACAWSRQHPPRPGCSPTLAVCGKHRRLPYNLFNGGKNPALLAVDETYVAEYEVSSRCEASRAMAKREASCAPRAAMLRKAPLDTLDNFEQEMQMGFYHIQC